MAEAHQAIVFAFNITDQGVQIEFDRHALLTVWQSGIRSYKKKYARFKNRLSNGIYPAKPGSLMAAMFTMIIATMFGNDLSFGYIQKLNPFVVRILGVVPPHDTYASCMLFAAFVWFSVILLYKTVLSYLLSYHGWMYESRGPMSTKTKIWLGAARLLISSKNAGLYSFQGSLPRLPVPRIEDTVERYLTSVEPLLSEEEMEEMRQLAHDFKNGLSKKLQFYLKLKSWWASNYVSDWWEEFVYLYSRDPIMVNSNYYCLDAIYVHPTHRQASRAASISWAILKYWRLMSREEDRPIFINNLVPLCSWQYERMLATTRIPGEEKDSLLHLNDTKHLVVLHAGRYYKVYFYYANRWLEPCELEAQFENILKDKTENPPVKGEEELAALTAGDRVTWARARKDFFSRGVNHTSLSTIERAAFVLVLDEDEATFDPDDPSKLNQFAKSLLHGNGCNRWFDKSFTLVAFKNGRVGFNAEHSWADAPVMGQLWEFALGSEVEDLGYTSEGRCQGKPKGTVPNPIRLQWDLSDACRREISKQLVTAQNLLSDVDFHLVVHKAFGKGIMKKCGVSPDAFIQLALQLAYFRDSKGKFCLTYEASMTRLFKEGRTETVRSCTNESSAFVRAMEDPKQTREERIKLLRIAADYHQKLYRDAMTGKGVDRHLFTLYVVSKYCKQQSPFLEKVLHCQWKLSTSQSPHGQTGKLDLVKHPNHMSPGGGFGPVSYDGYGVSYIIAGEDSLFFHVSSRAGCPDTDSARFGDGICKALADMKELCSC